MITQKKHLSEFNILNISVIFCALIICVLAVFCYFSHDVDAASSVFYSYTGTAVTNLNVRSGPGTDYNLVRVILAGTSFPLTGEHYNDGQRMYWRLDGAAEEWVTGGTNGANLNVKTTTNTLYEDTIKGYAPNGSVPWEHDCTQSRPLWYYHIEVNNYGYVITCDCGWFYERNASLNSGVDTMDDSYVFLGLDTDNDEFYDLKPGQSIDLPCRANNDMRPYIISEFWGSTANDPPTVTVGFFDSDGNELGVYRFEWWVDLRIVPHGIVMTAMNGKTSTHYVNFEFMLWYDFGEYYLDADNSYRLEHGSLFDREDIFEDGRHVEYRFTIKGVNAEDMNPLDWIVYWTKKIGNWVYDVFNFFGLGGLLTSEGSPFVEVFSLDGVSAFFSSIADFFANLPSGMTIAISIGFVGTIIIGLVRWFL